MSIESLVQVYDEVRRIAIAGSSVAPGDFRLKKLVPTLEAAGTKAPVFAKVAQSMQAVIDSTDKTAPAALLDLATLVNAILYTQGTTSLDGPLEPIPTTDLGIRSTQTSARVIKPLIEALTTTGSGRVEIVKDAIERDQFRDLRLIKYAVSAIDDPYPEIGDLIVSKVLPLYGTSILPDVRATFDLKSKSMGQQRRLKLMHQLDPAATRELVEKSLEEGSKEMKVVAIECLGASDADRGYLIEQSKAKAKDVRAAALRVICRLKSSTVESTARLKAAIDGPELDLIIDELRCTSSPTIQDYVIECVEKQISETNKVTDSKSLGPVIDRLERLIACLEGRTDARAEALILESFEKAPFFESINSAPSGADLVEYIAHVLTRGTTLMRNRLIAGHSNLSGDTLVLALSEARQTLEPSAFFDHFSPLLKSLRNSKSTKSGSGHDRAKVLLKVLQLETPPTLYRSWMRIASNSGDSNPTLLRPLDKRWLDVAIEVNSPDLATQLARPGEPALEKYLTDQVSKSKDWETTQNLLYTMLISQHPHGEDLFLKELSKLGNPSIPSTAKYWFSSAIYNLLPKDTATKIEAVLPLLPEKIANSLTDSVVALKNKLK